MAIAATPTGTPIPIPIFVPADMPSGEELDASGSVVGEDEKDAVEFEVGKGIRDADTDEDIGSAVDEAVEVEDVELTPGTPIVVKGSGSASKMVALRFVAHSHGPPRQQKECWLQKVMELPPFIASKELS